MQTLPPSAFIPVYTARMRTGRPSQRQRSPFGARVWALRIAAGFSQQQVADQLGLSQSAFALWERREVALKPEQLTKLAQILRVRVEDLLEEQPTQTTRGGPAGKARRVFEQVAQLPRHQQQKIIEVVEAFVAQQTAR